MELLHSEMDEYQVVCPNCKASWEASRCYVLCPERLYTCEICKVQFEVTEAMFRQTSIGEPIVGIPLKPLKANRSAARLDDDRHPLIADAERRAETAKTQGKTSKEVNPLLADAERRAAG